MRSDLFRRSEASVENERRKDGPYRGVGALCLLAGSGLVFSESRMDSTSTGNALGFLLILVGSGLMIAPRPEEVHPAP